MKKKLFVLSLLCLLSTGCAWGMKKKRKINHLARLPYDVIPLIFDYYSDEYSSNSADGAGIDCRWGGYFGYGSNYNPDEDCNGTMMSLGECQFNSLCN